MATYLSKNKKQLITDAKELICPYCNEGNFQQLHPAHLKKHGKTVNDARKEFPNSPTMTVERYNIQLGVSTSGGEGTKQKVESGEKKVVSCYYNQDLNCSHETREVPSYYPNGFLCNKCKSLGKESLDGREKEEANMKRLKTFSDKYNVLNAVFLKK